MEQLSNGIVDNKYPPVISLDTSICHNTYTRDKGSKEQSKLKNHFQETPKSQNWTNGRFLVLAWRTLDQTNMPTQSCFGAGYHQETDDSLVQMNPITDEEYCLDQTLIVQLQVIWIAHMQKFQYHQWCIMLLVYTPPWECNALVSLE